MNPSAPRRIALAGASGLVGRELAARQAADPACPQLQLVLRRPLPPFDSMPRVTAVQLNEPRRASDRSVVRVAG